LKTVHVNAEITNARTIGVLNSSVAKNSIFDGISGTVSPPARNAASSLRPSEQEEKSATGGFERGFSSKSMLKVSLGC